MPTYNTPREWIDNVPAEEWPMHDVACATEGCVNEGIVQTVPNIGQDVLCGACGVYVIERRPASRG